MNDRYMISQSKTDLSHVYFALLEALGDQAINYYRYGEKKDCSGKWDYFKLCISTKTKSPLQAKVRWYEVNSSFL